MIEGLFLVILVIIILIIISWMYNIAMKQREKEVIIQEKHLTKE